MEETEFTCSDCGEHFWSTAVEQMTVGGDDGMRVTGLRAESDCPSCGREVVRTVISPAPSERR